MVKKISHIGIAVKDLNEAIKFYQKLGLELEEIEEVPSQKVKVAFFPIGEVRIELLEATSEDSPIAKFIEKRGEGVHHLAFQVDDLPEKLSEAEEKEFRLIDKEPRPGAHGADIAFLHPKSTHGTLIEFCQEKE
ncbi:MAG: methylmalonyl-CoA epimerase [Candidatus Cloacimonadales bacterium]|nr:methylmalonyl-CoA epimerase [Candidatus Cloacimonadota bacterium]MDD2650316.1 methylmalonyl-CoA epimerase [Candidatus Cloacimonadota bacterium]MDD3500887.1 methylmalonyl-CoA epimerase [Candidatus Cloacimonadota bacterium]MDX9977089.1 methylmalonyl-CoA epimerase [Candidatus Cloacimonadales bacterium]